MSEDKSKVTLVLGGKVVSLNFKGFGRDVDVDELMSIDHGNLYGEKVTISTLVNKWGLLEAEAEREYNKVKMELSILESKLEIDMRTEAANNAGKFKIGKDAEGADKWLKMSNDSIAAAIKQSLKWRKKMGDMYDAKKDWQNVTAAYKGAQSKDRQLNGLVRATTPEELGKEIIEGAINGMVIKTKKSIVG
jgi:hypothetical protein